MREVRLLAAAVAAELGSPVRAADELRFVPRRAELDGGTLAIYLPPSIRHHRAGLILERSLNGWDRQRFFALAVGHHLLRHRLLTAYDYGADGALFASRVEAREAAEFADVFMASMRLPVGRPEVVDSARSGGR